MTGFEIRKRGSVPVFNGVVICAEFEDAVMEKYRESEARAKVAREKKRVKEIHSNWQKLVQYVSFVRCLLFAAINN
jgi:xeroderma pigmentosum group C-complementing protein